jgi:hypothetical protein
MPPIQPLSAGYNLGVLYHEALNEINVVRKPLRHATTGSPAPAPTAPRP